MRLWILTSKENFISINISCYSRRYRMEKDNETDFPSMKCAVIKRQFTRINKCNFQNGIRKSI